MCEERETWKERGNEARLIHDDSLLHSWPHGAPLAPIELVAGFDLLPPQVAVVVAAGTARARFDVPEDAMSAISRGELRFGRYTFSPSYSGGAPLDLLRAARNQLLRICKYQARGFTLTKADGERGGKISPMH